jgi:glycosyltransferase involved in cell wall biosynthesis
VTRYPGLARQAGWAVRRPRAAIDLVRDRPMWLAMVVARGLPRPIREMMARPVTVVTGRITMRPGDHPVAGPVLLTALASLDRPRAVAAAAERIGRTASPATAARLARIALAVDDPALADRLLDPHRAMLDTDPSADGLRGEVALRMGRYREAARRLERASRRRPHDPGLRRAADRAAGELALLDPAWRPGLPVRPAPRAWQPQRGRVFHVLTNSMPYRPAGYAVRSAQVARCQQDVGLEPVMITRAGFPGAEGATRAAAIDVLDGVAYHRIRPDLGPGLPIDRIATETAAGIERLVAELRPALLAPTSNYVNAQVALAVGERLGLPVTYEVRGFLEETWRSRMGDAIVDGDRYRLAREIETDCMRRASAVITLSETMRDDILARGGIDPDQVLVIPNAVDVRRFVPGPRDEALGSALGIGRDELVIGYITSLTTYEGIGYLIDAVANLHRRGRSVRLLLVGDGDARADLEARAGRAGLLGPNPVAIFTGRVPYPDIQRYYRLIDIFVVPRTLDRVSQLVTPLKPYEAMSMARPVVVSAVPALLEMIRDGETGRSFRPEDVGDLAAVIESLIDDPAERDRIGRAAREWVSAERSWSANGQRYLALYRRLGVA